MPLRELTVGNYRSFAEPAVLQIRPLTLLFGYNNSGKSALARVLPLIRDSLRTPQGLPLNLTSAAARGADFGDLRCKLTGTRKLELGLRWESSPPLTIDIVLRDLPERRQHVVEHFNVANGDTPVVDAEWVLPPAGSPPTANMVYRVSSGGVSIEAPVTWAGIVPRLPPGAVGVPVEKAMAQAADALLELANTYWVGAFRVPPPRLAGIPVQPPDTIDPDGRGAADVLAWDRLVGGTLFPRVAKWYADHAHVDLVVALRPESYSLVAGAHQVNLCDTGEGLTQVLPVLVAAALAEQSVQAGKHAYVVAEQPELHLHPAAHAPLADYFCNIASSKFSPQLIIETHSENFMYGVQLAIASGRLHPDRVVVYWVRQEDGRSTATPIHLDAQGRPDSWPRHVFAEDTELARQLRAERAKRDTR